MKEITITDCENLYNEFKKYCETAEQHQFETLLMIDIKLTQTIEKIISVGKVENQKEIMSMFRVVLKTIGKDYSKYVELS